MSDAPAPRTEPVANPDDAAVALDMACRLVRQFEGFRAAPYQDSAGVWTIGYGTIRLNGQPVTAATPPITMEQAEAAMQGELQPTATAVDGMLAVFCTPAQRAALYSFAYNLGTSALRHSTLLDLLNRGYPDGAAEQFDAWVYAGGQRVNGLVKRRAMERAVFEGRVVP